MNTKLCKKFPSSAMCVRELTCLIEQGFPEKEKNYEAYVKDIKPRVPSETECELKNLAKLGRNFLVDEDPESRRIVERRFVYLLKENKSKPKTCLVLWILTHSEVEISEETRQTLAEFRADPNNKAMVDVCMYPDT